MFVSWRFESDWLLLGVGSCHSSWRLPSLCNRCKKHPAMTTSFIWLIAKGESDDEAAAKCCQKPFPGICPQVGLDPPLQRDSIKRF